MFATTRTVDEALAGLSMEQFAPCDSDDGCIPPKKEILNGVATIAKAKKESAVDKNQLNKPAEKIIWNKLIFDTHNKERYGDLIEHF